MGQGFLHPQVCNCQFPRYDLTDSYPGFGTPVLLKWKANQIAVDVPPPPPLPSSPPVASKKPRHDHKLMDQMQGLLQAGAQQLDTL